jgi:hypothetical protein
MRHRVIKVIVLLPRRDGMSEEEFARYTREQHLPLSPSYRGCTGWW